MCPAALGRFGLQQLLLGGSELADQVGVIHTFRESNFEGGNQFANCFVLRLPWQICNIVYLLSDKNEAIKIYICILSSHFCIKYLNKMKRQNRENKTY